jgi:membrane associated rhomboid family serine protease
MGFYDRDYEQEKFYSSFRNAPQMRMTFPQLTPAVKWLLIINVAVFLVAIIVRPLGVFIYDWLQLDATSLARTLQFWRLITYQFLHDPQSFGHIFFNMLGLYFLGPTLERYWGSRRFLGFYLGCGLAGGVFYLLLVTLNWLEPIPMVGASGAILGLLAACAIMFPHFVVFILIFPVPIRIAAIGLAIIYFFTVVSRGITAGGDAAHLAGMATGALYVLSESWRRKLKFSIQSGLWERKAAAARDLQAQVDRILDKVHQSGIHSLTMKEKRILRRATHDQQKRNGI